MTSRTDTSTKIRVARDKLVKESRAALMNCTPNEALEAWKLIKGFELSRTVPGLTSEQKVSLLKTMATGLYQLYVKLHRIEGCLGSVYRCLVVCSS